MVEPNRPQPPQPDAASNSQARLGRRRLLLIGGGAGLGIFSAAVLEWQKIQGIWKGLFGRRSRSVEESRTNTLHGVWVEPLARETVITEPTLEVAAEAWEVDPHGVHDPDVAFVRFTLEIPREKAPTIPYKWIIYQQVPKSDASEVGPNGKPLYKTQVDLRTIDEFPLPASGQQAVMRVSFDVYNTAYAANAAYYDSLSDRDPRKEANRHLAPQGEHTITYSPQ